MHAKGGIVAEDAKLEGSGVAVGVGVSGWGWGWGERGEKEEGGEGAADHFLPSLVMRVTEPWWS